MDQLLYPPRRRVVLFSHTDSEVILLIMEAYIYQIINKLNKKIYIGQTIQPLHKRWSEHCNNSSCCVVLKAAIAKYGKENFEISIIETIFYENKKDAKQLLNEKEKQYIQQYNSLAPCGYNILRGGSSIPGRRWKTPPFLGKKWTEEHRKKFIASKTGQKYGPKTPEQIERFRRAIQKPIKCNETGMIWSSVKECANYFKVKPKQISRVLKKQRKRLKWRFTFSYLPKQSLHVNEVFNVQI